MRRFFSSLALLACFMAPASFAAENNGSKGPPLMGDMERFRVEQGKTAFADFKFSTLDGMPMTLKSLRGRMVLVNVWASWCGPCVEEMPSLDSLAAHYPADQLTIVALSIDRGGKLAVERFLDKVPLKTLQPYLETDYSLQRSQTMVGLPTSFLIDPDGQLLGTYLGPADWDSKEAHALINWYLAKYKQPAMPSATPTSLPNPDALRMQNPPAATESRQARLSPLVWQMIETSCGIRCHGGTAADSIK